jgi:hypothetical protein
MGLCIVDIARMREATDGIVEVRYWNTEQPLGHAHVQILGCGSTEIALAVALTAQVVRAPLRASPAEGSR